MSRLGTYQNVMLALVAAWGAAVLLILALYAGASWWFRRREKDPWRDL